jgi:hypothetical protein
VQFQWDTANAIQRVEVHSTRPGTMQRLQSDPPSRTAFCGPQQHGHRITNPQSEIPTAKVWICGIIEHSASEVKL